MKKQRGLSLIELMIALLIGSLITAAILQLFLNSNVMYQTQDSRARMQEDGRYALNVITPLIQRTSYQAFGNVTIKNVLADQATSYIDHLQTPIEGYAQGDRTAIPKAKGGSGIAPNIIPANADTNSDVLTIRVPDSASFYITAQSQSTAPLTVPGNTFKLNNKVMASSIGRTVIFNITSINGSSISHNTDLNSTFFPGLISKISTYTFYIATPSNTHISSLYEMKDGVNNGGPIIEGVERMRILYGVDSNGNGKTNGYFTANNVSNWSQVISVKVSLVMININDTGKNNGGNALATSKNSQYTLPNTTGGLTTIKTTDGRLRTIYTQTIILRNRLP